MKLLLRLIIMIMLPVANGWAQGVQITNLSGTTAAYGTYNVSVTGGGSFLTGGGDPCIGSSQYWCGASGPGWYTYTVDKPVTSFTVHTWGVNGGPMDGGEYYQLYVNGTLRTLVPGDVTLYSECAPGGGPMYISTGTMMGPTPSSGNYNGSDQTMFNSVSKCGPVTSFELWCNGTLSGVAYVVYMDTVKSTSCFNAENNHPCQNDTLKLYGQGDSTGATYWWTGPGGFTSTMQDPFIFPALLADSGVYTAIKTFGGFKDTATTDVVIRPLPVVKAGSNSPICSGGTLVLTATVDSLDDLFTWTGPNGFTSSFQNPSITSIPVRDGGIYKINTSLNGCYDSDFVKVVVDSTPAIPAVGSNSPLCSQTSTLLLNSGDVTPGVSYRWAGPSGFTSTMENPFITGVYTGATGTYTVTAFIVYQSITCADSNTVTVAIDSTPYLPVLTSNSPLCSGNSLNLTATSTAGVGYSWTGPNSFSSTLQNPSINPATTFATGTYTVTAESTYVSLVPAYTLTCTSNAANIAVVVDSTPVKPVASTNSPGFPGVSICAGDTLKLFSSDATAGVAFIWIGPNSFLSTIQNPVIVPVPAAATGVYTVTASLVYTTPMLTCSAATIVTVSITPTPPLTATSNSMVCSGDSLFLQAASVPGATFSWTGPYTFMSTLQNPTRIPAITEYAGIYQVVAMLSGCPSATVNDTVVIHQTPPAPWVKWLTYCQYYPPSPLQAFGDSITWYNSSILPATANHTPPIPSTTTVGQTFYFATQTVAGCTSAVDSILVSVFPKPVISVSASVSVCPRDSTIITVTDTDPLAYYHWFPSLYLSDTSSRQVVTRAENNTHYMVVASNQYGCTDTGRVSVTVNSGAVLTMSDSITLHPGEKYQLNPQTNCTSFNWFPSAGLDNPYASNPIAAPQVSTKYIVNATTESGCAIVDSIVINVDPQTLLALPNAFTPGTGSNNEFKVIKQGIAQLNSFNIFDRWGQLLFSTNDIDKGWDGTYKGVPQPFGVYVYEINAVTSAGRPFVKKGNVTLVR
jgi:gliding motility-associated-like protein